MIFTPMILPCGEVDVEFEDPSDILNLSLWLDANVGVTLDGSDNVSLWEDQSVWGHDFAQTDSDYRPHFVSGELNSLPVIRFDRSIPEYLDADSNWITGASARTSVIVLVNCPTGIDVYDHVWHHGINGTRTAYGLCTRVDSANYFGNHYWQGYYTSDFAQTTDAVIITQYYSGTIDYFRLNGVADSSPNTVSINTGSTWMRLGSRVYDPPDEVASFDVAEWVLYNRQLDGDEIDDLEGYFATKYDITIS